MARIYAEFTCAGQGMERTDGNVLAEGARGTVGARFALCSKWDGLTVYAHFQRMTAAYDVPLENGEAEAPADVMKAPGFFVSVFGETEEGERLTSERVFVELRPSLDAPGVPAPPMDRTLLQILEAKVQECIDMAAALRADADAGAFDGDPFRVSHVFGSVAEMEAHEGAEVGAFAVINSGEDQEDNARVYQRQADGWLYLADMRGMPGRDGLDGDAAVMGAEFTAESDGAGTWTFGVENLLDPKGIKVPVPVEQGGTGATDAEQARANIGAAAADHGHDGVYSKEGHTHSLSSLGAAAEEHGHSIEDLEGVAPESHSHAASDVSDMADYVVAQGESDITIADKLSGTRKWVKFANGLAIVEIEYTKPPISVPVNVASGSLYTSGDAAWEALPFTMAKANAFGSVPGWATEVRARVVNGGKSVAFNYRSTVTIAEETAAKLLPTLTVIGRWK